MVNVKSYNIDDVKFIDNIGTRVWLQENPSGWSRASQLQQQVNCCCPTNDAALNDLFNKTIIIMIIIIIVIMVY